MKLILLFALSLLIICSSVLCQEVDDDSEIDDREFNTVYDSIQYCYATLYELYFIFMHMYNIKNYDAFIFIM
jgi:hypothetical protein